MSFPSHLSSHDCFCPVLCTELAAAAVYFRRMQEKRACVRAYLKVPRICCATARPNQAAPFSYLPLGAQPERGFAGADGSARAVGESIVVLLDGHCRLFVLFVVDVVVHPPLFWWAVLSQFGEPSGWMGWGRSSAHAEAPPQCVGLHMWWAG